jgi:hypothetical protein
LMGGWMGLQRRWRWVFATAGNLYAPNIRRTKMCSNVLDCNEPCSLLFAALWMKRSYYGKRIHVCLTFVCDTVQHTLPAVKEIRWTVSDINRSSMQANKYYSPLCLHFMYCLQNENTKPVSIKLISKSFPLSASTAFNVYNVKHVITFWRNSLNIIGYSAVFMEESHGFKHRVKSPAEMSGTILKLGK